MADVMKDHNFDDSAVKRVRSCGDNLEFREIEFVTDENDTFCLSEEDIVALAKDMGLEVWKKVQL